MKFLLDTDHISILQLRSGQEYATLATRMAMLSPADFAFCIVSFHEQVLGAHAFVNRAGSSADLIRGYLLFGEILQGFKDSPVLLFDQAAADSLDDLHAKRVRMATMDLRIAAIALSNRLVLLTRNSVDFGRVPGLVTEDWTM